MDPTCKQQVGYLLSFNGVGLSAALATNITVYSPYNNATAPAYGGIKITAPSGTSAPSPTLDCVGIMENFSWTGAVADPICMSFYLAAENANLLKAQQSLSLPTTSISTLSWWIVDYDEETKQWFEVCYPLSVKTLSCQLNAHGAKDVRLHVADQSTKIAPTIDVNVYQTYMEIVPAAQQMASIFVATSPKTKVAKAWGLVVGTIAKAALAPSS
jgi:hypothetical protein